MAIIISAANNELMNENIQTTDACVYIDFPDKSFVEHLLEKVKIQNSCKLTLFKNYDRRPGPKKYVSEFVHYDWYLEVEPTVLDTENSDLVQKRQVAVISEILEMLWSKQIQAVAVCDFAALLPLQGGYPYDTYMFEWNKNHE